MFVFLFPITLFLSALLLFSIQPMVAKALLPVYGGTPAVWTVCILFFQIILLLAYAYAWLLSRLRKRNLWRYMHAALLLVSLVSLPLLFHPRSNISLPEWSILYKLLTDLGIPLLVLAASAPLLQFAYSQTSGKGASDPYFLYVASNLGSLLALILYPWLIERFIGLAAQFYLWSLGYGVYLILLFIILFLIVYKPLEITKELQSRVSWMDMAVWLSLAFIPCSLMMGVTLYISTDIAATPLFWVLPLALYLLSFVFSFSSKPLISQQWLVQNSIFFLIFPIVGFILKVHQVRAWELIIFNLLSFFLIALFCHRQLYNKRPKSQDLTLFYLCLAFGGVLAGIFNGILSRQLFNQVIEYPLVLLLTVLVFPIHYKKRGIWVLIAVIGLLFLPKYLMPNLQVHDLSISQIGALLALTVLLVWQQNKASVFLSLCCLFAFIFLPGFQENDFLLQKRSFYAVNRVMEKKDLHVFFSQSTVHGIQMMTEKKPLDGFKSYYGAIKSVVETLKAEFNPLEVTLMGLGTGTMVCQFRDKDIIKVIEIDQQVIDIARNPKLFTYLRDCSPVEIIKNDGRLAMESLPDASQKLLVLDAFNSDAIPVHLMTLEAFKLYKSKISEDGVILVNISNRHLNLLPVINAMGRSLDLMTFHLSHQGNAKLGQFDSDWAMLTSNEHLLSKIMTPENGWHFVADNKQLLWTDDYSNILPLLKW